MSTTTAEAKAPLKILYPLHHLVETLDFTGPLEIFAHATHAPQESSPSTRLFSWNITSLTQLTTTTQNLVVSRDIDIPTAYSTLHEYDVLVIPGGGVVELLNNKDATEPYGLIQEFVKLAGKKDADGKLRTRWLFSICTGSLLLARAGALGGLKATTHLNYYDHLREISEVKVGKGEKAVEVVEERFVVNRRNERSGLRVVTAGGVSCGMDAALWIIGEEHGEEVKNKVERVVQYSYTNGVVL